MLGKLVEVEELDVDEDEVEAEIDRIVEPFEGQSEELRKTFNTPSSRRHLTLDIITTKAIKRLTTIARGEAEANKEPAETSEGEEKVPDEDNIEKE